MQARSVDPSLNYLKKVLDKIERYEPNVNIGLRSFKNLGVWLIFFALTEASHQQKLIHEVADHSNIDNFLDIHELKETLYFLIQPTNLQQIILDYENTDGQCFILLPDEISQNRMIKKSKSVGLYELIKGRLRIDEFESSAVNFQIKMKSSIKFTWASKDNSYSQECTPSLNLFNGIQGDFLTAYDNQHNIRYNIVELGGKYLHVTILGCLQTTSGLTRQSTVYFIEPIDQNDQVKLQKSYYDIIHSDNFSLVHNELFTESDYLRLKDLQIKLGIKHLEMTETEYKKDVKWYDINVKVKYNFRFIFNFPKLASTLKTTENKLGIYSLFLNKDTEYYPNKEIRYLGIRELSYDKEGGYIENEETMRQFGAAARKRNPLIIKTVTITYTLANPYLLLYCAPDNQDYFPFFIADPYKNLINNSSKNENDVSFDIPVSKLATSDSVKPSSPMPLANMLVTKFSQYAGAIVNTVSQKANELLHIDYNHSADDPGSKINKIRK